MENGLRSCYIAGREGGGPQCEALEKALEEHYDVPHALVFNSGTSALHAALVACGVRQKTDKVLVPGWSMSASAAAILHAGGTPLFCDIRRDNYCLDWDYPAVQRAYDKKFKSWKAAVLVHLFGYHADPPKHSAWPIVHDAAQAPSLKPTASRGSDIWVYSLNQHKVINCGEGGYALTYKRELADKMHAVRNHGEAHVHGESCRGKPPKYYDCWYDGILGWNYRMTEMEAEIAIEELKHLDSRLAARRRVCRRFWPDSANQDWYIAPAHGIQVPQLKAKVGYVPPIYSLTYFKRNGYKRGTPCPVVEEIAPSFAYYMVSDIMEEYADSFSSDTGIQQPGSPRPVYRYTWSTDSVA